MTVIIIGAGAAGLATAIFAKRADPSLNVRCFDGAAKIGAKILVSGGSRCNVTNRVVTERDFMMNLLSRDGPPSIEGNLRGAPMLQQVFDKEPVGPSKERGTPAAPP